jgi:alpha-beta hydrolase superfamily lysophospholipase
MSPGPRDATLAGRRASITYRVWPAGEPRRIVLVAHGYGEHIGRYEHVAAALAGRGAVVAGPDHLGHGRSGGERVLIEDYEPVVADLHDVADAVRAEWPELPLVLLGHSMGGMIAARYAQLHRGELAGLVLSGPVLGSWTAATDLLALDEIPDDPLDVSTLSRDPRVGEVYAADELVWHGPFKRPTLEALARELETIDDGPPLGDLPVLWIHGAEDQLVPIAETRAGIARLGAEALTEHVIDGARHEVLNETNKEEVIAEVAEFAEAVTR